MSTKVITEFEFDTLAAQAGQVLPCGTEIKSRVYSDAYEYVETLHVVRNGMIIRTLVKTEISGDIEYVELGE